MSGVEDYRPEEDAFDYLRNQRKKSELADRRPVIRKAADLVGPGIGSAATRVSNWNDMLAIYNGFYSSPVGAYNAPNGTEQFVGVVTQDSEFGGVQTLTGLTSGTVFKRRFTRSPFAADVVHWQPWSFDERIPATYFVADPAVTALTLSAGQQGLLPMPSGSESKHPSAPSTYSVTGTSLNILRQGVYSGVLRVNATASPSWVTVRVPTFTGQDHIRSGQITGGLNGAVLIPVEFRVNSGTRALEVLGENYATGAGTYYLDSIRLTRHGDAV